MGARPSRASEDVAALVRRMGAARTETIVGNTNLKRLRFARCGIDIIATDVVLATC